ncbi:MAG: AAA family ATPase [Lentisphaeria bacterium]|nr:AAA family ATPase [Lentisphaeria bacterium]
MGIGERTGKKVYEWSCSAGIAPAGTPPHAVKLRNAGQKDPLVALTEVVEQNEAAIYLFKDFHPFLSPNNFAVIRKLRDVANTLKSSYKTLVLISPFLNLPPELEKDVTVIDYSLPNLTELCELLNEVIEQVKDNPSIHVDLDDEGLEEVLKAALGLTLAEAENVFAKALVTGGKLDRTDVAAIYAEKKQIIRKSGLLDYCEPSVDVGDIGGLDSLKDWLRKRKLAFTERAQEFGLPPPRGAMLLGVQGCGKSLCAKAVSQLWNLPLLRLDVGRLFSSLVGSSEENIRRAIRIAEGIAPCVLWVDEIDKAFGALRGTSTDSGTSQRVLGTFLTWMAEKCAPVFVVATANNIRVLPPEFLRKGRFDEIFFVDLPDAHERREVLIIHLRNRNRSPEAFDLDSIVELTDGFSGAELEQTVIAALFEAFYENRDLETRDLARAVQETVPLSRTMEEEIKELRSWCTTRARNASLPQAAEKPALGRRKLEFT